MNIAVWGLVMAVGAAMVVFRRRIGDVFNRVTEAAWRRVGARMTDYEKRMTYWISALIGCVCSSAVRSPLSRARPQPVVVAFVTSQSRHEPVRHHVLQSARNQRTRSVCQDVANGYELHRRVVL